MNISQDEQLSAFIDGEVPLHNSPGLSARLLQDRGFRQKMARYQKIGAALRQQMDTPLDAADIVSRIQDDLAREPHLLAAYKTARPKGFSARISRAALGVGLAATVAMLAIFVAPQIPNPKGDQIAPGQNNVVSTPLPAPGTDGVLVARQTPPQPGTHATTQTQRWKRLSPEQLQQLDHYLVEHNAYANSVRVGRPSAQVNFVAIKNTHQ